MLRDLAEGSDGPRELRPVERVGLSWIEWFLRQAEPRVIPNGRGERPVVLATDGAVEANVTFGAVLFVPVSGLLEFAGAAVQGKEELSWGRLTREQACGRSLSLPSAELVGRCWRLAAEQEMLPWLYWVTGPLNIADALSRLNFEKLKEMVALSAVGIKLTGTCWTKSEVVEFMGVVRD